jgi:hypothetical protein
MSDCPELPQAKGGRARSEALSKDRRSEIARAAALERWNGTALKATHSGVLTIGDVEIQCYVLEDGSRILSTRGIMKSLGRAWRGRKYAGTELPVFLEANNLKPFINNKLRPVLSPVEFRTDRGAKSEGYRAEILPGICEVYLAARAAGDVLTKAQESVAQQCEILIRGLAELGVIALVDEATGYQEVRDRHALQQILDQYLRKELAAWAKRFPDEFYREMFRLRGWSFSPISVSRPGVVGKYTNNLVYDRLAPGIVEELGRRNPKDERGNRKGKHHQLLTEDVGHPALAQHLHAVVGFMRASSDWDGFLRLLDRAFPRKGATLMLDLAE